MFLSSNRVVSVCFSSDGKQIASGSWDETVKIWNASSGELQSTLRVDAGLLGVQSVSFSPKDNVIAAGCHNGKIYLLDAFAGEVKSTLRGDKQVHCVSFSPDGDMLAAGDGGFMQAGNVRLYDVQTGEVKSTLAVDSGEYGVLSVSFSPKDNVIAAGCYNGKIHLVDAVAGEVKSTLTGHRYVPSPSIECLLL